MEKQKKILVVWYDYFQYLSGTVKALNSIQGVHAETFILKHFNQDVNILIKISSKLGIKYFKKQYFFNVYKELKKKIVEYDPDAVLFINADYREIVDKELLEFIKEKNKKSIVWFFDSLGRMPAGLYDREYLNSFDKIYSFDYTDIDYIKEKFNIPRVQHLPFGVDTFTYNTNNHSEKTYDICFVGNADEKRLAILEKVAKYCTVNDRKMVIYGQIWKFSPVLQKIKHRYMIKKRYPYLYRFVVNEHLPPRKVSELYSKSKICLNIIRDNSGSNSRIFEILSANTLQLIEYRELFDLDLADGKDLVMYKSDAELELVLNHYLKNDGERVEISQNGYQKTMSKYTTIKLLEKMMGDIKEER